jgi:hypothetical protein
MKLKGVQVHMQCTYPGTDKTGNFLKDTETEEPKSPLFEELTELFKWCRENGWKQSGPGLTAPYVKKLNLNP